MSTKTGKYGKKEISFPSWVLVNSWSKDDIAVHYLDPEILLTCEKDHEVVRSFIKSCEICSKRRLCQNHKNMCSCGVKFESRSEIRKHIKDNKEGNYIRSKNEEVQEIKDKINDETVFPIFISDKEIYDSSNTTHKDAFKADLVKSKAVNTSKCRCKPNGKCKTCVCSKSVFFCTDSCGCGDSCLNNNEFNDEVGNYHDGFTCPPKKINFVTTPNNRLPKE
eukprot:TRINITY_DN214_c0_g2_i2.p1 TRINITY_DN214_c0_g2~~TRINITY_DN214_c0_g2_i2.p1  ORF type:complete len:221 (+),score=34.23 TRINITY_DN214_c0_g2_i2:399-1061(+)